MNNEQGTEDDDAGDDAQHDLDEVADDGIATGRDGVDEATTQGSTDPEPSGPSEPTVEDPRPARTWKKTMSASQIAANGRNARRSTGPRTGEGKNRSSRNAVRHGGYISQLHIIDCGRFAEDPDEVGDNVHAIVDSLDPRTGVEQALAFRIAMGFVAHNRLDFYEAGAISAINPTASLAPRPDADPLHEDLARQIAEVLNDPEDRPTSPWSALVWLVVTNLWAGKPHPKVAGLWDDSTKPTDDAGWEAVFHTLIKIRFSSTEDATAWARSCMWTHQAAIARLRDAEAHEKAQTALNTIERVLASRSRVDRGLWLNLELYRKMRVAELNDDTTL